MKKFLKRAAYFSSLLILMALVFFGNFISKLSKEKENQNTKKGLNDGLFSAFEAQKAYADVPGSGGDGCLSGCSADGAGSSACGASGGS